MIVGHLLVTVHTLIWLDAKKWKIGCHDCEQKKSYPSSLIKDNSHWNWEKKRSFIYKFKYNTSYPM